MHLLLPLRNRIANLRKVRTELPDRIEDSSTIRSVLQILRLVSHLQKARTGREGKKGNRERTIVLAISPSNSSTALLYAFAEMACSPESVPKNKSIVVAIRVDEAETFRTASR